MVTFFNYYDAEDYDTNVRSLSVLDSFTVPKNMCK